MTDDVKPEPGKVDMPVTKDAEKPEPEKSDGVSGVIETWFRDHFVGSVLGATTELYNAAHAAKEDLKKRLAR